jgi:Raf kinase inhibitor-like YbhB/YbcL family protein
MPPRHALEDGNVSPQLSWDGIPDGTRSIAVICEDPDAPSGSFVHWLGWGIDSAAGGLGEGEPAPEEGRNDFGRTGYDGPHPPAGHGVHRYFFRVFALDLLPELEAGASRGEVVAALEGHVIAAGQLVGTFER